MVNKTFGTNLRKIRETLGLTLRELGERSKMTAAHISFIETKKRDPSLNNIVKLCQGLGCKPGALIDV